MKKDYLRSLITEFFIKFSNQFIFASLMVIVFERSERALDLGYMSIAMILPALIFTLFSNKIVHKTGPLRALRTTLFIRGLLLLIAAFWAESILSFAIVGGLLSLTQQISGTVKLSYDSILVSSIDRIKFNSKRAFINSISLILGLSIGGAFTGHLGGTKAMFFIFLINIVAWLLPSKIKKTNKNTPEPNKDEAKEYSYKEVWFFLKENTNITAIVTIYIIVSAILEMEAPLVFPFVKEVYGRGGDIGGTLLGICGLGGLLGAMYVSRREKTISALAIAKLVVFDGLCLLLFAIGLPLLAGYFIFGLLGIIGTLALVTVETEVQETVPIKLQPMIFSILQFAGGAGGAAITLFSTALADTYGTPIVLQGSALFEIVIGIGSIFILKNIIIRKQNGEKDAQATYSGTY